MLLLSQGLDAFKQLIAGLNDGRSCAGKVHAAVCIPLLAEEGAVVHGDAALCGDECLELVAVHSQLLTVEPCKVGALHGMDCDLGDVLCDEVADIVAVAFDVYQQLVKPCVAFEICAGYDGLYKAACRRAMSARNHCLELVSQLFVLDDDVGVEDAGEVEGLGGCCAGDGVLRCPLVDGGKDDVLALEDQVVVDLVGDDGEVMSFADLGQLLELFALPYAARGVVGRAEHENLGLVGDLGLEILEIKGIILVVVDEGGSR